MTSNEPLSSLEIDSSKYESKAEIKKFSCFSGHADYSQTKKLLSNIVNLKKVLVVHVEEGNVDKLINSYRKDFPNIEFLAPESGAFIPLSNNDRKS